jgi:hypothetical protein
MPIIANKPFMLHGIIVSVPNKALNAECHFAECRGALNRRTNASKTLQFAYRFSSCVETIDI